MLTISICFLVSISLILPANTLTTLDLPQNITDEFDIFNLTPDWISDNPKYSTGAELADINQDGWLDFVVADGNDMRKGHLNVYYNEQGSFSETASWQSEDDAFNGHLDIADVNGDGWPDVAVACLGTGSSTAPIARLYLNNEGALSSLPDWESGIIGNAFGVDFGDMNNDGRPDLAIATGWSYSPQHPYHNYVYLNEDGMLAETPSWTSDDTNFYQGVLWLDANNDGWLDLAGTGTEDQIYVYVNNQGILETTASWKTAESFMQDGIMLTSGDVTGDGIIDLFATDNTQLGGSGLFRQYTGLSQGFFETTSSWIYFTGYGSAVGLADLNADGRLDLAAGGWWNPLLLFYNEENTLPNIPQWYSEISSVIEKIVFGDIGPNLDNQRLIHVSYENTDDDQLFHLPHQPIQYIEQVAGDGNQLSASEYTYSREHGWVTIHSGSFSTIEIDYYYSKSLDMLYTNWDPGKGNFLYYNNNVFADLFAYGDLSWQDEKAGTELSAEIIIENQGGSGSLLDWEIAEWPSWGEWTFSQTNGNDLTPEQGQLIIEVTIIVPDEKNAAHEGELIIKNVNDANDFEVIPIRLTTTKNKVSLFDSFEQIRTLFKDRVSLYETFIQSIRTI